jgi:hypothetical protein
MMKFMIHNLNYLNMTGKEVKLNIFFTIFYKIDKI